MYIFNAEKLRSADALLLEKIKINCESLKASLKADSKGVS